MNINMITPAYESFVNDIACEFLGFGKKKESEKLKFEETIKKQESEKPEYSEYKLNSSQIAKAQKAIYNDLKSYHQKYGSSEVIDILKKMTPSDVAEYNESKIWYENKNISAYFSINDSITSADPDNEEGSEEYVVDMDKDGKIIHVQPIN